MKITHVQSDQRDTEEIAILIVDPFAQEHRASPVHTIGDDSADEDGFVRTAPEVLEIIAVLDVGDWRRPNARLVYDLSIFVYDGDDLRLRQTCQTILEKIVSRFRFDETVEILRAAVRVGAQPLHDVGQDKIDRMHRARGLFCKHCREAAAVGSGILNGVGTQTPNRGADGQRRQRDETNRNEDQAAESGAARAG